MSTGGKRLEIHKVRRSTWLWACEACLSIHEGGHLVRQSINFSLELFLVHLQDDKLALELVNTLSLLLNHSQVSRSFFLLHVALYPHLDHLSLPFLCLLRCKFYVLGEEF